MNATQDSGEIQRDNQSESVYALRVGILKTATFKIIASLLFFTLISASLFHEYILPTPGSITSPGVKRLNDTGLGGVEFGHGDYWRWAYGPETTVLFSTSTSKEMVLNYSFNSPIEGQGVTLYVNNKPLRRYDLLPASFSGENVIHDKLSFHAVAGENTLRITYDDWNGHKSHPISGKEKYALCFYRLFISK